MTWKQCLELKDTDDILIATTIRRHWLGANRPTCPKCGEANQLQLVEYLQAVPDWRCRKCKHKFKHEPEQPGKPWKS